jgi:tetratricopeptide (TPR) repeat protein
MNVHKTPHVCIMLCTCVLSVLVLVSCNALTTVENPNVTDAAFLRTPGAMTAWLRGCERQTALTTDQILMGAEIVSDNYFNNRTLYNRLFDIPRLESSDVDIATIAQSIGRLREMADYGLTTVAAADASTTNNQRAELWFFKGLALLYAAEYFVALPNEARGEAVSAAVNYRRAAEAFQQAIALTQNPAARAVYHLALGRTRYYLGDKASATDAAQAALSIHSEFTRFAQFDPLPSNGAFSVMQIALYTGQDEFQPLPRLDFLDPKYYRRSATQESPVCLFKAEEAHLILAEAAVSDNQLAQARTRLKTLIELVAKRPVELVDERAEARGRRGGTVNYPLRDTVSVAASPQEPLVRGLVRSRWTGSQPVAVPVLSGTSVTAAAVDAASTAEQLLELVYLMRQEIFMAEGRRMVDLGIKFPLPDIETDNNPRAAASAALNPQWKQGQIGAFIPLDSQMNAFTFNEAAGTVVIRVNMNRVLVQNRASQLVVPF